MNWNLTLLLCLSAIVTTIVSGQRCIHDDHIRSNPPPRQTTHIPYPIEPLDVHGKRSRSAMAIQETYQPIRIHIYSNQLDTDLASSSAKLSFLKNNVLPKAAQRYAKYLMVNPVQGALGLGRTCVQYVDGVYQCKQYSSSTLTCGSDFGAIPSDHIASQPIYSANNTISGYTTGGPGVNNTDVIIYVAAKQSSTCTDADSATLAYASYCVQDQYDRPIAGYINFCQDRVDTSDEEKAIIIAIHEIGHALGYSSSLYPYYRKPNGDPYSLRRINSSPYQYKFGQPPSTPSTDVMNSFTERDMTVKKLVMPLVLEKSREHYGCTTLNGLELENQGGSGTETSHPEMRNLFGDFMNGMYPKSSPIISAVTLAVFEATGWYKANFTNAEYLSWGKNVGCDFLSDKCLTGSKSNPTVSFPKYWCKTSSEVRCTQDLMGFGLCSIKNYDSVLPSHFQYFSSSNQGGSDQLMDYCPFYDEFNWQSGGVYPAGKALCTRTAAAPSQNARGEVYGASSRCVVNTLLSEKYVGSENSVSGGCFKFDCATSGQVRILVGDTFITCSTSDEGKQKTVSGYKGYFVCPSVTDACASMTKSDSSTCDIDCGSHGSCQNGECVCASGWKGTKCDEETSGASITSFSFFILFIGTLFTFLMA